MHAIFLALFLLVREGQFSWALEQQWYRTGQERNGSPNVTHFGGSTVEIWELFGDYDEGDDDTTPSSSSSFSALVAEGEKDTGPEEETYRVFFGGVLRTEKPDVVEESKYESFGNMVKSKFTWMTEMEVLGARVYDLYSSPDFAAEKPSPYSIEVAQLNIQRQIFENNMWRNVAIGFVAAVTVVDVTSDIQYRVLLNADAANRISVTYFSTYRNSQEESTTSTDPVFKFSDSDVGKKQDEALLEGATICEVTLKVISYNIWHTMPPAWVYHDARQRIDRYTSRMQFLAEKIIAEGPDVVLFQEVRLDSSFRLSSQDAGSQVEHLLHFLRQAEVKMGLCGGKEDGNCTRWNIFFQPAMSMFDKRNIRLRHEEGLAIFTRAELPLYHPGVLLLPRDMSLISDDHNRAVLGARIPIRSCVENIATMTSHFSLDASAREQSVSYLLRHIRHTPYGIILGGDLNGEPGEEFLRMLVSGERKDEEGPFHDAFQAASTVGCVSSTGSGHAWVKNGFTFPTCNPEKRIDFLLFQNASHTSVEVEFFKLLGTDHQENEEGEENGGMAELQIGPEGDSGAEDLGGREPGVGMLDSESHLWASDHFGIASVFKIESIHHH